MIQRRKSSERGYFDHGWLKSYHTFSFSDYHDPEHMGMATLRVINEDFIAPDQGFNTHGHQNMEIVTYVISGELSHKDSMGNGSKILAGDVQYMSAGSGVKHSEFSHGSQTETHLLQIWLLPHTQNTAPAYDQKNFSRDSKINKLKTIVAPQKTDDAIVILNHSFIYVSILQKDRGIDYKQINDSGYAQVISGSLRLNDQVLHTGDGAYIKNESQLHFSGLANETEFIFFDLK